MQAGAPHSSADEDGAVLQTRTAPAGHHGLYRVLEAAHENAPTTLR
jgi:hypothetical protein